MDIFELYKELYELEEKARKEYEINGCISPELDEQINNVNWQIEAAERNS